MPVGKVRLLGENFLKGRDGGLKLLLVDVALGFVKQIVERIGKLLRFGLAGWLCFCGSLRPGCRRIILINRGIPSQSLGIKLDRKSTRLNSSHSQISYAVFCLKKKKINPYTCEPSTSS